MPQLRQAAPGWYWYMPAEHETLFWEAANTNGPVVVHVTDDGLAILPGDSEGPWNFDDLDGVLLERIEPPAER